MADLFQVISAVGKYVFSISSQPSGKTPSIPTFLQSCTWVRRRSICSVAGHFFHHVMGMRCITHVDKHGHLRFVVLVIEAFYFFFFYHFFLNKHTCIPNPWTGFAAVYVSESSLVLLWRLMVEDYCGMASTYTHRDNQLSIILIRVFCSLLFYFYFNGFRIHWQQSSSLWLWIQKQIIYLLI